MALDTYEKVIAYLESYIQKEFDIETYQSKLSVKGVSYPQEEKGSYKNNDMVLTYIQKIDDLKAEQLKIEKFIEDNFNGLAGLIIYERYINNKTYEEIGEKTGYSYSHVPKLIRKAIYRYLAR